MPEWYRIFKSTVNTTQACLKTFEYLKTLLCQSQVSDCDCLEAGHTDGGHSKDQLADPGVVKLDDFCRFQSQFNADGR